MERKCYPDQALTVYWLLDSSLLSLFLFSDSQEPIVNDIKLKDKFSLQSVMDSMCWIVKTLSTFPSLFSLDDSLVLRLNKSLYEKERE